MSVPGSASPLFFTAAADAAAAGPIKSVRFSSGDSAYLNRTPSSAGNRKTWTWSGWVKLADKSDDGDVFAANSGSSWDVIKFETTGKIRVYFSQATNGQLYTVALLRDQSAWYHLHVSFDSTQATSSDRFKLYLNGTLQTLTGTYPGQNTDSFINGAYNQTIGRGYNNSKYFNGYLADVYFIDGSALDPTSFGAFDDNGVWQSAAYSGTFGTNGFHLFDFANESGIGDDSSGNDNDFTVNNIADSAISYGTTSNSSQTNANTYIVSDTRWSFDTSYPGEQAFDGSTSTVGSFGQVYFYAENGYSKPTVTSSSGGVEVMASGGGITAAINEGTQVACANGSFTKISGTFDGTLNSINVYGNTTGASYFSAVKVNGVHIAVRLRTESPEDLDVLFDVPTNGDSSDDTGAGGEVSGNYATLNPLVVHNTTSPTFSNGNLEITDTGQSGYNNAVSTIGVSSGKWYVECTNEVGAYNFIGIQEGPVTGGYIGNDANGWSYAAEGYLRHNSTNTSYGSVTYGAGDVIGIALDLDSATKTLTFYKNGTSLGTAYSGSELDADVYHFGGTLYTTNDKQVWNFGQRPFAYTAPSGFKALNTASLPTPTIADGSDYFNAITYTGDGVNDRTITTTLTTVGAVWIRRRNASDNHRLGSVVQGGNAFLSPNLTGAENNATSVIRAFSDNTFDLGTDTSVNSSSDTYVAWAWDAGTSTVSNTDGSITSSVRANPSAGFSIVSYTGTETANDSVGHGLNAAPELIITKNRDSSTYSWRVLTTAVDGSLDRLFLNATSSKADQSGVNVPTSSVFYVGSNLDHNKSGDAIIAYCFAPVAGYSAFGSYTGNGSSTDGPFVFTGFAPAFVLIKNTSDSSNWIILDNARDPINAALGRLSPNLSNAEDPSSTLDFTSTGFKIRRDGQTENINGNTYIWAAFASNPFQANGGLAR